MGLLRKRRDETAKPEEKGKKEGMKVVTLQDETAAREAVAEKVRLEMLGLFSPSWTSQTDRMLQYIFRGCSEHDYFECWDKVSAIISVKTGLDQEVFPSGINDAWRLSETANLLNSEVCFLMTTSLVSEFVRQVPPGTFEVVLSHDLVIQVRRDLRDFQYAKRNQHAAILSTTGQILIWDTSFENILPFAIKLEESIAAKLWKESRSRLQANEEKEELNMETAVHSTLELNRPVQLVLPGMVFSTILLIFLILALATRVIVYESLRSGNWYRFAVVLYFPIIFFLTAFFALMLVVTVINFIGPVAQLFQNSKFYSCVPPKRITRDFPHIVIQCPVYKEDLADVIVPTVQSLKIAVSTYERQGGTASIFINDDGLQLISAEQRELRKAYYKLNDIGWVARPGHGKNGFSKVSAAHLGHYTTD